MQYDEEVDVVIVGSGAAGSVFAAKLAEKGKRVKVLEAGPAWTETDLYSSPMWARRLRGASPQLDEKGKNHIYARLNSGRGTGGAALHHYAVWPRFQVEDFKRKSLVGHGLDWPIEYKDLRQAYDAVQEEVGISGDAKAEVWRPPGAPYPLPPLHVFKHGEKIATGFERLGLRVSPIPIGVLSRPYHGRNACVYDGWCDAGCPIGALANPLAIYLAAAIKNGAVVQADSHVTRVLTDKSGKRASGVEYKDKNGTTRMQPAKVVVVAASTVETIRTLLNSSADGHPTGLGNSSGLLGHYLMAHPAVVSYGLFDEDIQNYLGASGGQLFSQDKTAKAEKAHPARGRRHWEIGLALKPVDIQGLAISRPDLFGADLERFMQRASRGLAAMTALSEDEPVKQNRIVLSNKKDKYGMYLAEVHYNISPNGLALYEQSKKDGVQIFQAAGTKETWTGPLHAQHIAGGTVMGSDAKNSVTDAYGRLHDVVNVFIGGGSVFPTLSHANATYTIHATAWRSARYLTDNWSKITN